MIVRHSGLVAMLLKDQGYEVKISLFVCW